MKKFLLIFFLFVFTSSCQDKKSEEQLIIHNQKVAVGKEKQRHDFQKKIEEIDEEISLVQKEYEDVNSFKIGRLASTKMEQLSEVEAKAIKLVNQKKRVLSLIENIELTFKPLPFQSNPKTVVQNLFDSAKKNNFDLLPFLIDPYGENDEDVELICYVKAQTIEDQAKFIQEFKKGRIIGEPMINGNMAKIDFLYGGSGNKNGTMVLTKRNGYWYLHSY